MQVIVLVGGLGTRLRPLTDAVPKPLLPICDIPMIEMRLHRLRNSGVEHVVLAVAHHADAFRAALGDGSRLGVAIEYSVESFPLGTGGALRQAHDRCTSTEPVLVLNGDLVSDLDVRRLLEHHLRTGADVTIHADVVDDVRRYGALGVDEDDRVLRFDEKGESGPKPGLVNAGTYVWTDRAIQQIPPGRVCSLEKDVIPSLISAGMAVRAARMTSYWVDAGTRSSFLRVNADAASGVFNGSGLPGSRTSGQWVSPSADVAHDAAVTAGSVISSRCTVGRGSRIEGSVLLPGATVGRGACVRSSIVGPGGSVPSGAVVVDEIVAGDRHELPVSGT
jgi:mannose-1-phosphate guanylyltransferase